MTSAPVASGGGDAQGEFGVGQDTAGRGKPEWCHGMFIDAAAEGPSRAGLPMVIIY